jgi:hypothetical protein
MECHLLTSWALNGWMMACDDYFLSGEGGDGQCGELGMGGRSFECDASNFRHTPKTYLTKTYFNYLDTG